jgi:hypothetical protein
MYGSFAFLLFQVCISDGHIFLLTALNLKQASCVSDQTLNLTHLYMFTGVLPPPQHGFLKYARQTLVSLVHTISYSRFPQICVIQGTFFSCKISPAVKDAISTKLAPKSGQYVRTLWRKEISRQAALGLASLHSEIIPPRIVAS